MSMLTRRQFLSAIGMASVGIAVQVQQETKGASAVLSADEVISRWIEDKSQELQDSPLLTNVFSPAVAANIRVQVTDEAKKLIIKKLSSILSDAPICAKDFEVVLAQTVTHVLSEILSLGITRLDLPLVGLDTLTPTILINSEQVMVLQDSLFSCSQRPCYYKFWCDKCPKASKES